MAFRGFIAAKQLGVGFQIEENTKNISFACFDFSGCHISQLYFGVCYHFLVVWHNSGGKG